MSGRVETPSFSGATLEILKGKLDARGFNRAVDEAAHFYRQKYDDESIPYQAIGERVYRSYPSIGREGLKAWVSLV
jgi:hypothetical protein